MQDTIKLSVACGHDILAGFAKSFREPVRQLQMHCLVVRGRLSCAEIDSAHVDLGVSHATATTPRDQRVPIFFFVRAGQRPSRPLGKPEVFFRSKTGVVPSFLGFKAVSVCLGTAPSLNFQQLNGVSSCCSSIVHTTLQPNRTRPSMPSLPACARSHCTGSRQRDDCHGYQEIIA